MNMSAPINRSISHTGLNHGVLRSPLRFSRSQSVNAQAVPSSKSVHRCGSASRARRSPAIIGKILSQPAATNCSRAGRTSSKEVVTRWCRYWRSLPRLSKLVFSSAGAPSLISINPTLPRIFGRSRPSRRWNTSNHCG
ncbi:hypothetical protein D3C80_1763170 [compost metagenome]